MTRKKTVKKSKKKKLPSIPSINRKLFRLWSLAVRERAGHQCEYCGIKKGDLNKNGKPTKIDAHHLMSRSVTDSPLKFDIRNGIAVCPFCHKFSPNNSFHNNAIVTTHWLKENRPDRYDFVLKYYESKIDLKNREILASIEESLNEKEPLDIEDLIKKSKKKTLFDD
jgi:hypothetical protein